MRTLRRSRSRKASSSRSLAEDVYRAIREAILANRFEAGLLLSERELARRLAVSKTPVREALIRLAHEGFVEVSPRRGMLLPKASVQDLKELFAVRSALEGLAAETAVGLIPAETLARLRQGLAEAARDKDQERLFQLGAELHELAIQASGNQRLASIVGTMRAQIARYSRLASTLPEQSERSLREHLEVIDALERGDGAGARRAIEAHIRGVRDNLIRALL